MPIYKFLPLPTDFDPVDATIAEVASYRREFRWTVHQKLRVGTYEAYKHGRMTKVIFASVKRDRERALVASRNPTGKRRVGPT